MLIKNLKLNLIKLKNFDLYLRLPHLQQKKTKKEKREFYIPRLSREKSLYGTEFEVKLRNELTQKAVAKECAEWIRNKVIFKSNITNENMGGFLNIQTQDNAITYMPLNGFTTVDIGCERAERLGIRKSFTVLMQRERMQGVFI